MLLEKMVGIRTNRVTINMFNAPVCETEVTSKIPHLTLFE